MSVAQGLNLYRFIIVFSCFLAGPLAAAEPTRLAGDAIKQTVAGSLLELDTPLGTTVAIRFNENGLMAGDAKELATLLGAAIDRGRWWVANDQLCYKWFKWFDAEARCLMLRQADKRLFWQRDDGESGTATLMEQGKPSMKAASSVSTLTVSTSAAVVEPPNKEKSREGSQPPPAEQRLLAPNANVGLENRPSEFNAAGNLKAVTFSMPPAVDYVPAPRPAVRPAARTENALRLSAKPQSSAKSDTTSFMVSGVDEHDVLNIRRGPSEDDLVVGEIPPTGHGITIVGRCLDDWCPIKHRSITGWVNRYYLAQETPR
jgi:hypothetical protein